MKLGLLFFSSAEDAGDRDKYRLVLEGARFADQNGFSSVSVPERHFTPLGCLYPNPAVLQAAVARETRTIELRAGSVVLPLHHPARVAEEWAMVDNLSNGRVAISFAPGWNPQDFVFAPGRYAERHKEMFRGIELVRRLWRGETVPFTAGDGVQRAEVRIYPTPLQRDLPVWVTAARSPETFRRAGEIGANVLTHLFDHDTRELAEKIAVYRHARAAAGHPPETGQVTVMLHTLVGDGTEEVLSTVREPFKNYMKSNLGLLAQFAQSRGARVDTAAMAPREIDELAGFVADRYATTRALFGTPESCLALVAALAGIGVDEIACLLDYGLETDRILAGLPALARLRELCAGLERGEAAAPVASVRTAPAGLTAQAVPPEASLEEIRSRLGGELSGEELYRGLSALGVDYGAAFRGIERLWRSPGEALARIRPPAAVIEGSGGYSIHPALLDACLQALSAVLPDPAEGGFYMPTGLGRFRLDGPPAQVAWSHARLRTAGEIVTGDVRLLAADGRLLGALTGVRLERLAAPERTGAGKNATAEANPAAGAERLDRAALLALPPEERRLLLEGELRRQAADLLGIPVRKLPVDRPLDRLGLDSLMAMRLKNHLDAALGRSLPIVSFLQGPSVADLTAQVLSELAEATSETGEGGEPPIRRLEEGLPYYPASFAQQRIWFLEQLEPGSPAYIIPAALALSGRLDAEALRAALEEVVARHEALRTRFFDLDGRPVQAIVPPGPLTLHRCDLRALPDGRRAAEMKRLMAQESAVPFDLATGRLLRATLVRQAEAEHTLLLTLHHIAADGWSLGVLVREMALLYTARRAGHPSPLPPLPVQYKDYAAWQRELMTGEVLARQLDHWRRHLGERVPDLVLPTDRPASAAPGHAGGRLSFRLPAELAAAVLELGREEGATLFMVLLAAFAALLHRTTGQEDVVVGTDFANRNRAETEPLIGFFINVLPLRSDLRGDPTFRELLARVRESALGAYAHQDVPFDKLVEALQPERGVTHSPLFRAVLVLQNVPSEVPGMPGLRTRFLGFGHETVRFDLSLLVTAMDGGIEGDWTWRSELFEAATVERLHRRFETLLRSAVDSPGARLSRLSVLTEEEKADDQRRVHGIKDAGLRGFRNIRPKAVSTPAGREAGREPK
jgi:natural product biosynthesis luciferase-like monooxygenase protein